MFKIFNKLGWQYLLHLKYWLNILKYQSCFQLHFQSLFLPYSYLKCPIIIAYLHTKCLKELHKTKLSNYFINLHYRNIFNSVYPSRFRLYTNWWLKVSHKLNDRVYSLRAAMKKLLSCRSMEWLEVARVFKFRRGITHNSKGCYYRRRRSVWCTYP